jgi:2-polyprenyl-6-methoxyphenol hydroxylase-like FAD-dependent oxidoreductase
MKVLVSGAGIAGPCVAYWLERGGHEVTLVERAPAFRTGGYVVDFWGAGFDIAERMGVSTKLLEHGYKVDELRQVDRSGRRETGFAVEAFDRLTNGRYTTIARSDISAALYDALGGRVETIFGDGIETIADEVDAVRVRFERGGGRAFDLVIGADGLHSRVRTVVFGDEHGFEHYLGMKVAAFSVRRYRPRDELTYVIHTELGQQIGRFAMRDDRTMFVFVYADSSPAIPTEPSAQKRELRTRFESSGWECPAILDALDGSDELYMDRVSQIRMKAWSRGRVALVGDAAYCISLLGGQGSALAMIGAYVLAGELARAPDHATAFARYEARLHDFIASKQKAAVRFGPFFAPRSKLGILFRNQVMKLMTLPFVADLAVGKEIRDAIELPDYFASPRR